MTKMKFKRSAMALAVAGAIGFAAPAVQAVNLADDGLGEVLIFPYYTVRNGYDTYLNITNASADTVAVKVHFKEAHNSQEARDFNVILSPYDVWVAAVTLKSDGSVARVQTTDKSCTVPQLPVVDAAAGLRGVDFTDSEFTDGGPTGLDRTKEGYVSVFEMGVSPSGNENLSGTIAYRAKHVGGVPRDCAGVVAQFENNIAGVRTEFNEPKNNLKGTGTLIKVDAGKAAAYEAVALANFYNPSPSGADDDSPDDLIRSGGDLEPDFQNVFPKVSVVKLDTGAGAGVAGFAVDSWTSQDDPVTAVLMRQSLLNQFNVAEGVNAETDMVITFPTKRRYVDTKFVAAARAPFARTFQKDTDGDGQSCDQVGLSIHDREEFSPTVDPQFSPPPPSGKNELCKEVNVLTFNGVNALGSNVSQNIDVSNLGLESGWLDVAMDISEGGTGPTHIVSNQGTWFYGLPAVGFSYTTLENGVAGDNLLNYGSAWNHAYRRNIVASGQ